MHKTMRRTRWKTAILLNMADQQVLETRNKSMVLGPLRFLVESLVRLWLVMKDNLTI